MASSLRGMLIYGLSDRTKAMREGKYVPVEGKVLTLRRKAWVTRTIRSDNLPALTQEDIMASDWEIVD